MVFYELVEFIRREGCAVRLYNRTELKGAKCEATFCISKNENPVIAIALLGFQDEESMVYTLLHEYAHYLQWVDGYWDKVHKENEGWDTVDKYLRYKRKRITEEQIKTARRTVLLLEYDAEMRTINLARFFCIRMNEADYLQSANTYMLSIKWALENKQWKYPELDKQVSRKVSGVNTLLAPLTSKEKKIMEG